MLLITANFIVYPFLITTVNIFLIPIDPLSVFMHTRVEDPVLKIVGLTGAGLLIFTTIMEICSMIPILCMFIILVLQFINEILGNQTLALGSPTQKLRDSLTKYK